LRLSANNLNIIKWWVDASYGVHHDMRSHAGGTVSLGTGAACSTSKKQKLNTKSSTEAELVGIDDVLPQALWTKHFMEALRATELPRSSIRTIKALASSPKMARHPAEKGRDMSTSGVSLSPTNRSERCRHSTLPHQGNGG
jgi:hypothetical protein